MKIEIFSPQDREPTDTEIVSFWRLVFSPPQLLWNPDDSPELAKWEDKRVVDFYRNQIMKRTNQFGFWAIHDGEVVGHAGLRIPSEPSRSHCGELGFGVDLRYQRRGIGIRLLSSIEKRATVTGLRRIECSCFAGNGAAIALLQKAGFVREGCKRQSIRQGVQYVDQVLFAKLIGPHRAAVEVHVQSMR